MIENVEKEKKKKNRKSGSKSRSSSKPSNKKKGRSGSSKSSHRKSSKNVSKKNRNKSSSKKEGFKNRETIGFIGDLLFYVVVFLIIGGSAFVYFGDKNANIMNHRIMTVLTDSMKQNKDSGYDNGFSKGSMVLLKNEDPYTLKVGDIITYNPVRDNKDVFLTHRIVKIDEELKEKREAFITTRGDANTGDDVPIGASQVTGKVVKAIPSAGFVLSFLKKNVVIVAVLISTMFGIIVTLKYARTIE